MAQVMQDIRPQRPKVHGAHLEGHHGEPREHREISERSRSHGPHQQGPRPQVIFEFVFGLAGDGSLLQRSAS